MSLGVPENPIDVSFREGIGAVAESKGHQPWILREQSHPADCGRIRPFWGSSIELLLPCEKWEGWS